MPIEKNPFMFQMDVFDSDKKIIKREKMVVSRPVGGKFRVTNGDMLCDVTLDRFGVLVRCQSKKGDFEYISTKRITPEQAL
ncbi:MAG: hypothetical protein KAT83_04490 [Candidatus Aenigmarchaeota archaeon]|nr:hypothetical protein [Candidatus Aenigmarchaeota archaeon]